MLSNSRGESDLARNQQRIKDSCYHPTGHFIEFKKQDVEKSIPALFETRVRKSPERIALADENGTLTYAGLNQRANRIGHAILAQRGNDAEPIALLLEQGAAAVSAIMGLLKCGKIYVPIDPLLPRQRIDYILTDSQAPLIVTNQQNLAMAKRLAGDNRTVLNIDSIEDRIPSDNPTLAVSPESLAYIIYTSGSTGKPKGVMDTHRNILHETMTRINNHHLCSEDRLALLHSYCFYVAVKTIFPALISGAGLYVLDVKKEGVGHLVAWLRRHEITISSVTLLLRECRAQLGQEGPLPHLRLGSMGGDTIYRRDIQLFQKYLSEYTTLRIGLASTEAKDIAMFLVDQQTQLQDKMVPVGYPTDGKYVCVVDEKGTKLGHGKIGEITVTSQYLAPGYWRKADITASKFRPDPQNGNYRTYLTGDLGLLMPDGCIRHVGRKGLFVKIRGYSVQIAEVEAALLDIEAIDKAAVIARKDRFGDRHLVAYIVPLKTPAPTVTALRIRLANILPDYMLPSAFVMMQRLPLTATGKIDRRALPEPSNARPELDKPFVAPQSPIEKRLAAIWAEVLDIEPIGINDNFLYLGGSSLKATRILSRIRDIFQIDIPLPAFFNRPTLADLGAVIFNHKLNQISSNELEQMVTQLEAMDHHQKDRSAK